MVLSLVKIVISDQNTSLRQKNECKNKAVLNTTGLYCFYPISRMFVDISCSFKLFLDEYNQSLSRKIAGYF